MSKWGQILTYAPWSGFWKIWLKGISANSRVKIKTYSSIIQQVKSWAIINGNPDLCASENLTLKPNSVKSCNAVFTPEQKTSLIDLALSDTDHCQIAYEDLDRSKYLYQYSKEDISQGRDQSSKGNNETTLNRQTTGWWFGFLYRVLLHGLVGDDYYRWVLLWVRGTMEGGGSRSITTSSGRVQTSEYGRKISMWSYIYVCGRDSLWTWR